MLEKHAQGQFHYFWSVDGDSFVFFQRQMIFCMKNACQTSVIHPLFFQGGQNHTPELFSGGLVAPGLPPKVGGGGALLIPDLDVSMARNTGLPLRFASTLV